MCKHRKNFMEDFKIWIGIFISILVIVLFTGCTFSLDGLKAKDGDKEINLEHVEGTD